MRAWTRSALLSSVLAGAAATTGLSAVSPAAQQSGDGAQVVVRATTSDGNPVLDLKPADVMIRVDGRERAVKALDLVRPAVTAAAAPGAGTPTPVATPGVPPPYATNAASAPAADGGREFLIAIDDDGIAPGRDSIVREAVDVLISTISAGDAIGIVSMRRGGASLPPTRDRAAVRAAFARVTAAGSGSESLVDLGCRTKALLAGFGSILQNAPVNRTILLFSSGVATPTGDQIRETLGKQADADAAVCLIRQRDLDDLSRLAGTSPAAVIVVFVPEAIANPAHLKVGEAGLENVAGATGGEMIRMTGSSEAAMTRIGETAGTYYLATLAEAVDRGKVNRVDARVNRDSLRVTARPIMPAAPRADVKAGTPKEMIRVATVFRDVPIRAAGFVTRQPGAKDLKVVALFEPEDPSIKLTAAMVGLFDETGNLKAQWTAQPGELGGSLIVAALSAAPGKYRMRVAASDASGKAGTTDYELAVELADAPPVKLSHMLLGVGQGGFAPKLAFTPADAAAIGFIEIYGVAKDAKVEAIFEIINGTEVMGAGQGTVGAGPGEDARIAYGGFGLAKIEPGDYTLRATISVDGKPAGIATRTLRKFK